MDFNMKRTLVTVALKCLMIFILAAPVLAGDGDPGVAISIKNIKTAKGSILVAVYDNSNDFMKKPAFSHIVPVTVTGELIINTSIPFGSYSITIFHDINDNRSLDTNFMGIPKEPYGFSNNAKGHFGPPTFEASSVSFHALNNRIEVTLR